MEDILKEEKGKEAKTKKKRLEFISSPPYCESLGKKESF